MSLSKVTWQTESEKNTKWTGWTKSQNTHLNDEITTFVINCTETLLLNIGNKAKAQIKIKTKAL